MKPMPGVVLVRPIDSEESVAGGKILLPEMVRDMWTRCQAEVVASGGGARCTDEDCERPHVTCVGREERFHLSRVQPGDWVLVPPRVFLPTPDPKVFAIAVDDCWAILGGKRA